MEEYKLDIEQSRKGNLGSSDARMLQQIAELGVVPKSAVKRLAIVKGLAENDNVYTPAMAFGDRMELEIFSMLKSQDDRWQSNPCLTSTKFSRKNANVIDHVDYLLQDDEKKVITIGEAKATRLSFRQAREEYRWQLAHHWLVGNELAKMVGNYTVRVLLCVYDTNEVDYNDHEFDPSRLTVKQVRFSKAEYDLGKAMDIVDDFLDTLEYYTEDESVPYEYLPENVQKEFDSITTLLTEIKQREATVEAFKAKLYEFLQSKNIKSIKNDSWSITRVDPTTLVQFDSKRYLDDYAHDHPKLYKKMREKYGKRVNKKGFVSIKIKDNK